MFFRIAAANRLLRTLSFKCPSVCLIGVHLLAIERSGERAIPVH